MLQFAEKIFKFISLLLLPLLFSCSAEKMKESFDGRAVFDEGGEAPAEAEYASGADPVKSAVLMRSDNAPLPASRKVRKEASCRIAVFDIEEALLKAGRIALSEGGSVLFSDSCSITIIVPKEKFDKALDQIASLGKILEKNIEAADITDIYCDIETRLSLLYAFRDRLNGLLKASENAAEKVRILKELKNILKEIGDISERMEALKKSAAFSLISAEFESSLFADLAVENPFGWIADLAPSEVSLDRLYGRIRFPVSEKFALFERSRFFHAESADGVIIRTGCVKNVPEGSGSFWQKALYFWLGDSYAGAEIQNFGILKGVLFTGNAPEIFRYFVGAAVKKSGLIYIVEVVYPDDVSYAAYREDVEKALKGFRIK